MVEEHKKYYMYLEKLRKSGVTNMYGARPFLENQFKELDEKKANEILIEWMKDYAEISKKYYK